MSDSFMAHFFILHDAPDSRVLVADQESVQVPSSYIEPHGSPCGSIDKLSTYTYAYLINTRCGGMGLALQPLYVSGGFPYARAPRKAPHVFW